MDKSQKQAHALYIHTVVRLAHQVMLSHNAYPPLALRSLDAEFPTLANDLSALAHSVENLDAFERSMRVSHEPKTLAEVFADVEQQELAFEFDKLFAHDVAPQPETAAGSAEDFDLEADR
jgi:hypothetical protein